ncbi:hypothetical protein KQI76_07505 [Amphibacillus sp. MSJ-3]|uniref:hypothetical protein n=1 Tax=Amphibacillus sp. MSJ-3 TaxID=2841505 RepID=UPI001C0EAF98|nr:hypothetical protein [Amphibacillus sp. MSJ-3]MBU5595009.1 hypothetical protein [Amphibacillus sp. MSJ-3]
MKFFKLLKYDFKNGFQVGGLKLIIIILMTLAFCLDFYLRKNIVYMVDSVTPSGTWIDYLFSVFAGIKEYTPSITEEFIFPIKWLLIHLFILYSTLYYPYRDLSSLGLNVLVRTKGRLAWWLSKSIWNISYVLVCHIFIFLTIIIFCLAVNEPISLEITPMFVNDLLDAGSPFDTFPSYLASVILLMPIFISIVLNLVQMTLGLFIKPLYSFGMMTVILLTSAYFLNPFLIGNYAMPIRSEYVIENGLQATTGVMLSALIITLAFLIGSFYFKRYDILDEE